MASFFTYIEYVSKVSLHHKFEAELKLCVIPKTSVYKIKPRRKKETRTLVEASQISQPSLYYVVA